LFEQEGDTSQAFHYYSESYRYFPCDLKVISWLGSYYKEAQLYEQAIQFYERANFIEPMKIQWKLQIADGYRKSGNYQEAFNCYKKIHETFTEDVECKKPLVLSSNLYYIYMYI
jgi:intraflagellar transport protein 88